jgi:hypothetical protein
MHITVGPPRGLKLALAAQGGRARSAYSAELSWRPLPGGPCHLQCDTGKVLALSGIMMSNLKPDKLDVGQAPAPVILNAHLLKSQNQSGKAGFIFSSKNKTLEHTKVLLQSDVYFSSPPASEPAQLSDAQLNPS